ncbi:ATP-dependent DNA helicase [Bacillus sp. B4-WWTP-NA-D-NA-NA]|uniref:ATP-dependent DNA helicase n=1 Tax=Bacillus sp. B4-WWTP-NA-D-NA-NA TaxID=2653216 RepID=UPI0012622891|nr:AAA family ATPase [Bacillus sp. B4-WWTP-NA-D-NA-NA]KAB7631048.1 AAA family ATPase [Bacillus sp. B4-WWTP-NA-D-NA-NA]
MALDTSKCGKKTVHLQAKDTGKHQVRLMTCNKLECPRCQPVISARIQKKVRWNAQEERLFFFNTITSKDGFEDLDNVFKKIRKDLTFNSTIEGYMKKKKVDYDKALVWYEKKKKKLIESDLDIELQIMARMDALIKVAKLNSVYYMRLSESKKIEFRKQYADSIKRQFDESYRLKKNDNDLCEKLREKIEKRFSENEHEDFKFIRVLEYHKSGQPHYHFLSNKYISHTLLKKVTVEGVSEVYDNTYIIEDAISKNKELNYENVDTDIVANYVSKITNYVTKDTVETFIEIQKENDISKKLISSSNSIKIFDDNDDEDLKFKKIGVFDYQLNSTSYEVPEGLEKNVEDFIKFHSVMRRDEHAIRLSGLIKELDLSDEIKYSYMIHERLLGIASVDFMIERLGNYSTEGLTFEQLKLMKSFIDNRITLLLGRAGTGKTYTLVNLLKRLKPNPSKTIVCTYTGKASSRIRELLREHDLEDYKPMTIHKTCSSNFNSKFLRNEFNTLDCAYLIIDEVSMIPREILGKLLQAVPGHVKIIFAGDDAQLPPVNDTSIIPELEALDFVNTVRLTQVFRSEDAVLGQAYNVLSRKSIDYDLYSENMEDLVQKLVAEGYQILTNTRKLAKVVNLIVQADKKDITKCFNDFKYDLNDRVMIIANSSSRNVSNGDTGKIIDYDERGVCVRLDLEDREVFYKYEDTEEIVPAYAFTVHKSQGSEYENVAVFVDSQPKLNTNNLLYTGITRAKKNIKVYVPNEMVLNTMINTVPEPVSNVTLNNVFDVVHGVMDIKKSSSMARR